MPMIKHVCACGSDNVALTSANIEMILFNDKPINLLVLGWTCYTCGITQTDKYQY